MLIFIVQGGLLGFVVPLLVFTLKFEIIGFIICHEQCMYRICFCFYNKSFSCDFASE